MKKLLFLTGMICAIALIAMPNFAQAELWELDSDDLEGGTPEDVSGNSEPYNFDLADAGYNPDPPDNDSVGTNTNFSITVQSYGAQNPGQSEACSLVIGDQVIPITVTYEQNPLTVSNLHLTPENLAALQDGTITISFDPKNGSFRVHGIELTGDSTPEPATMVMFGLGALGAALRQKRFRFFRK